MMRMAFINGHQPNILYQRRIAQQKRIEQNRNIQRLRELPQQQRILSLSKAAEAVPSKAVPSKAVPSKAVPSKAVPSKAVPSKSFDRFQMATNMRIKSTGCGSCSGFK